MPSETSPAIATDRLPGPSGTSPLTADLAEFMQSGISIIVGSVGADGFPVPRMAHGCLVDPTGRVRVTVGTVSAARFLDAVALGQPVAATFTRPEDHRSMQLKAAGARVVPATAADVAAAGRQSANFANDLATFLFERAFSEAYAGFWAEELTVIEFLPQSAFVQTPGPGAGAALTP